MEVLLKKIDLHIHTVPTISDSQFTFSLETFKRYVAGANLDAVAVTNHDVFDGAQFRTIQQALNATVFPGIEVNLEKGHVLIISNGSNLDDFEAKTSLVSQKITKIGDTISVEELEKIFGNLGNYLVIPHYDKNPPITGEALERIRSYVSAGEVDSAKKFIRTMKDDSKLTPVLFSDVRIRDDLTKLPTRQTFIDCGEVTLDAIKLCLRDRTKVALTENDGNNLWQIFEDGQKLSTGLNVLLGGRSSGKTYSMGADFIFVLMEAWSLRKDKLLQMNAILNKYGSIGASPYAVDVVSMSLETQHGVWMAEVPIKPKGISKMKRTIGSPEFRHFTEAGGRFVNLLPIKDGPATLH